MEIRKYLKIISLNLILAVLATPIFCVAYPNETTHPALTKETVELFNHYYPDLKLSDEKKEKIMQGSVEEDEPHTRCLNHFYDPIYEKNFFTNYFSICRYYYFNSYFGCFSCYKV